VSWWGTDYYGVFCLCNNGALGRVKKSKQHPLQILFYNVHTTIVKWCVALALASRFCVCVLFAGCFDASLTARVLRRGILSVRLPCILSGPTARDFCVRLLFSSQHGSLPVGLTDVRVGNVCGYGVSRIASKLAAFVAQNRECWKIISFTQTGLMDKLTSIFPTSYSTVSFLKIRSSNTCVSFFGSGDTKEERSVDSAVEQSCGKKIQHEYHQPKNPHSPKEH
jgi:hypothetical protein